MRKLALSDALLLQVQKPARYLGNEMHAVYKDRGVPIRFAMCFPDLYEIGMSHLGIQILYEMFNRRADTWCERVFSPWTDMEEVLRANGIPLFALESQDPVRCFDFLGITLQFELCYTNILQVLDLSGIPLLAADRTEADPIVIGGGPCACNPEPVAAFFDMFYIGEGETSYDALLDLYRERKEQGAGREAFLREASRIPGIYVPSLYEVAYGESACAPGAAGGGRTGAPAVMPDAGKPGSTEAAEGTAPGVAGGAGVITSFRPKYPDVPARVRRQVAADLDDPTRAPYPVRPLIPFITVTQDRVAVELQRGCIRGCRFCQAGMIYRPNRERKLETVRAYADAMLANTGQDDILLSSLSSSDYSCIRQIAEHISDRHSVRKVKLNVPSLRIDAFSLDLMARVQDVRRGSLTFAPEAGSQRLRDVINKGITKEEILAGAREAFRGGWSRVKLYFMLGLPTETEEDRTAISDLANEISAAYYEEVPKPRRNGRCQITVSTSFFVPKPFTPFQWAPMYRPGDYLGFAATVNHAIYASHNHRSIQYSWHDAQMIYLEGVLARGDRRTSALILEAYRRGARFDAWLETWQFSRWEEAAAAAGISMDFYAVRPRERDEVLPWDFIDAGVQRAFLWREWERAQAAELTPNCREACSGCGAASYGCGICVRDAADGQDGSACPPEGEAYKPDENAENENRADSSLTEAGWAKREEPAAGKEEGAAPADPVLAGAQDSPPTPGSLQEGVCIRVRMRVAKYGPMAFIGHLELMRFLQKCLRRTDIQVRYSDGITPRMIMSTAMPLGLGLTSSGEYIDMELGAPVSTDHALAQLRPLMPEGLEILDLRQVGETVQAGGGTAKKPEKAMSVVAAAEYLVRFREAYAAPASWQGILRSFAAQEEIPWTKPTKKGTRTLDMKPLLYGFDILEEASVRERFPHLRGLPRPAASPESEAEAGGTRSEAGAEWIYLCVCSRVGENLRPEQLIGEAFRRNGFELPGDALQIHRIDLFAERAHAGMHAADELPSPSASGTDALPCEEDPAGRDRQHGKADPAGQGGQLPSRGPGSLQRRFISLGEMGHVCGQA